MNNPLSANSSRNVKNWLRLRNSKTYFTQRESKEAFIIGLQSSKGFFDLSQPRQPVDNNGSYQKANGKCMSYGWDSRKKAKVSTLLLSSKKSLGSWNIFKTQAKPKGVWLMHEQFAIGWFSSLLSDTLSDDFLLWSITWLFVKYLRDLTSKYSKLLQG